jgi:hypothetical protein
MDRNMKKTPPATEAADGVFDALTPFRGCCTFKVAAHFRIPNAIAGVSFHAGAIFWSA